MKIVHLIAGAAVLSIAAPAAAQLVTAKDPQSLVRALQAEGYQAKTGKDKQGDPKISSSASGSSFDIFFYGCTANKACTSIQFSSGYDTPEGKGPSHEEINEWNRTKRFAMAALDKEADPWLTMDVFTGEGGLPTEAFKGNLDMWTDQMAAFEKHIGWSD